MTDTNHTEAGFAVVDITGLHKRFGENEVLKGIDLKIKRKEVVCCAALTGWRASIRAR